MDCLRQFSLNQRFARSVTNENGRDAPIHHHQRAEALDLGQKEELGREKGAEGTEESNAAWGALAALKLTTSVTR